MIHALGTIFKGVTGLGRAAVNADPASEETVQLRRERCAACAYATAVRSTSIAGYKVLSPASRCKLCKCMIGAKTKLRSERCPIGSW